jgi:hypothetical protein
MSALKWKQLVKCLKSIGFVGPFKLKGKKHPFFMKRGIITLHIPNDHGDTIGEDLLTQLRYQGSISKNECRSA